MTDPHDGQPVDEPPPFAPGEVRRELPMPERPVLRDPLSGAPPAGRTRRSGGAFAVLFAGLGVLLLSLLLVVCSGGNLTAVIVVGGIFAFAAFHYLIWGWWLSKAIRRQVEQEEQQPPVG